MRMVDRSQHLGFALQARHAIRIFCQLRRQNFYGYIATELAVSGPVHFAHAALTQKAKNFVGSKASSDQQRHIDLSDFTLIICFMADSNFLPPTWSSRYCYGSITNSRQVGYNNSYRPGRS